MIAKWDKTACGNQEDICSTPMKEVFSELKNRMDMHGKNNSNSYWACGNCIDCFWENSPTVLNETVALPCITGKYAFQLQQRSDVQNDSGIKKKVFSITCCEV